MSGLPLELRPSIEAFLANCLAVFDDLDATLLEMNPFTLDPTGKPFPLDIRMVRGCVLENSLFVADLAGWTLMSFVCAQRRPTTVQLLIYARVIDSAWRWAAGRQQGATFLLCVAYQQGRPESLPSPFSSIWPVSASQLSIANAAGA